MSKNTRSAAKTPKRAADLKTRIGWREWASLPDLGVERINAKIDTGAESSALHASKIEEIEIGGEAHVEFTLHPLQRRKTPQVACCEPIVGRKIIRSSNGEAQERIVIRTQLHLGAAIWEIDLTLTDRDAMGFRMLIGRDALCGRFMVDPGASQLLGR